MLNNYLKLAFLIVGVMAIIYVIFNFKDFVKSWGAWLWLLAKGIGNLIKKFFLWIISIFKKEK